MFWPMFDFYIHSPIDEVKHPLLTKYQVRLSLKRDDQIHPFISGNKWRKLKYHLLKANQENKKHLVTFGGVWSNHLLATACAAARFGFTSTGFVRGEDLNTDVLFLCRTFGMQLAFTDRESYRDKQKLFHANFSQQDAYFIDEGGYGAEAALGCAELVDELETAYDHLFCAAGTGCTAAGILNGLTMHGHLSKTHIIPVIKGADALRDDIQNLLGHNQPFSFHTDYHFGGYAKTSPELFAFIQEFSQATGILLDPVYTGKMLYAIFDKVKKGYFKPNETILAIHTGGLFGLLGMKEKFGR